MNSPLATVTPLLTWSPENWSAQSGYLSTIWLLLLAVVTIPVVLFLARGWRHRREDILSNISPRAAAIYLVNFHSSSPRSRQIFYGLELAEAQSDLTSKKTLLASEADLTQYYTRIRELGAEAHREAGVTSPPDLTKARQEAQQEFERIYNARFGRWVYAVPAILLLILIAAALAFPLGKLAQAIATNSQGDEKTASSEAWGWVIAFAILGGYVRVVFELTSRYYQDNLRPGDLFWACYRVILSVPLGYAVGVLVGVGSKEPAFIAYAAAFLLGLFPTATVVTLGRRWFNNWTKSQEQEAAVVDQLKAIPSLDQPMIDLLIEEGITTQYQLAYTDYVLLSMRTGVPFAVVTSFASDALLAVHLQKREDMEKARRFGIAGAFEVYGLWERLRQTAGPDLDRAQQLMRDFAQAMTPTFTFSGLEHIFDQIHGDTYAKFIWASWSWSAAE